VVKPRWLLAGAIVVASPRGEEEVVQQVDSPTPTATAATSASPSPGATPQPSETPLEDIAPSATPDPALPSPTPTVAPGKVLFRWANVTLLFTPGQGIFLFPTWVGSEMKPPSGGHAIEIIRHLDGDNTSNAFIDADTAAILVENITLEDRILMDSVLETRRVSPLDRSTAPWPYNGEPGPTAVRLQSSRISFIHPALETGLHVYQGAGDPGGPFINMKNERSSVFVQIDTSRGITSVDTTGVAAEDAAAFERWLASLKRCDIEIQC